MNEHATVEDITDGEAPRQLVPVPNPRLLPIVVFPVVYNIGHQVGVPVQEITMLYRLGNNPRQLLQDITPTPQNIGRFVVNVGINEGIGFVAQFAGVPVLPVVIGLNMASNYRTIFDALTQLRPSQQIMNRLLNRNFALLTDATRESIDPLSEPQVVLTMDDAEDFRPPVHRETSLFSRCCVSFWSWGEQQPENTATTAHTEPGVMTEYDTSNCPRFGKQKTE